MCPVPVAASTARVGVAVCLAVVAVAPALAAPVGASAASARPAAASSGTCVPQASVGTGGTAALSALSSRWDQAAAVNGLSTASLRRILREDGSARLDRCSRLFYVEPAGDVAAAAGAGSEHSGSEHSGSEHSGSDHSGSDHSGSAATRGALRETAATSTTFTLSSRPSSKKTIYLDFTGHRLTGTIWNEYFTTWGNDHTVTPYDSDGDPSAFSSTERRRIRDIWERVSEDYAPFDVNVTTRRPTAGALNRSSASDTRYGTRVVITSDSSMVEQCGCSGIAALGVFDLAGYHEYYQPALVNPAAGTESADIANVVSHEVGHTLGLSHDGSLATEADPAGAEYYGGQGVWRPIMGAGPASARPLSQWSRGEYADASNTEDDLDVIASHGPKLVRDDHGDVAATATALRVGAVTKGRITSQRDTDWFVVKVTDGTATITLTPRYGGGNLDARLDLFDLGGLSLARDNLVAARSGRLKGIDARIVTELPAGTYNIRVKGVGNGTPDQQGYSAYGSLGRYTLHVDVAS